MSETDETRALSALADDARSLKAEEEECDIILHKRGRAGFQAAVCVRANTTDWTSVSFSGAEGRVARYLGEVIVDFIPQMLELVLERRRQEVQAHRDRVMAPYQTSALPKTGTIESLPMLKLALVKRDG